MLVLTIKKKGFAVLWWLSLFLVISLVACRLVRPAFDPVGKIIIIDPGHGGIDPGANLPGIAEKDINLAVALKLRELFTATGAKVILTRDTDTELSSLCQNPVVKGRYHRDLTARVEMAQQSGGHIFISLHANSSRDAGERGGEVFYDSTTDKSRELAGCIQSELNKVSGRKKKTSPGDFFVLRNNPLPAVLVEMGFITNNAEQKLLESTEYQHQLAQAIYDGVIKFFRNQGIWARLKRSNQGN